MRHVREIGVVSPSYSGSSLLNLIMDSLPGVVGVGESHWIRDGDPLSDYHKPTCLDCSYVKVACPSFPESDLARLRSNPADWYQRLARLSGSTDAIFSTEKSPLFYESLGVPGTIVILYKDLRALVTSSLVHRTYVYDVPAPEHSYFSMEQVIGALYEAMGIYKSHLEWAESKDASVVVFDYTRFTANPIYGLELFCSVLGLPTAEADIYEALDNWWRPGHHYFGGNFCRRERMDRPAIPDGYAGDWGRRFRRRISVDTRWQLTLSEDQATEIRNHPEAVELLKLLGITPLDS